MRTNTHDNGHGGAYVRKREVRALARVCSPMAFIVALLAVLLVPTIALADSSVIWGPSAIPNAENGIVVNAPDRYRAAAVALGYGDDAYSAWSDDVKAKLSNASTGGHFYEFAQLFGEIDDAIGDDNPLTTVVSAVGNSFWAIAETLYGDNIWLAGYSGELAAGAASDLSSILSGENIGGGGSGGEDTEAGTFHLQFTDSGCTLSFRRYYYYQNVTYYPNELNVGGTITPRSVPDVTYKLTNINVLSLLQDTTLKVYIWGSDAFGSGGRGSTQLSILITDDAPVVTTRETTYNNQTWTSQIYTWTYHSGKRYYYLNSVSPSNGDGYIYTSGDIPVDNSFTTITANIPPTGNGTNIPYYMGSAGGGGGEPVVPPTNWPDEPSAPTPPELPEPGTNPTVTPTPWAPVISPTFDFDLNITTEPTSNDLIDWVKKIYYELRSFHSDEQDWFDEVGKGMDALVDAIDDAQEQIYDELQTIDETLRSEGQKIRDYMYQMFHWLKDQLNFQNDTFNDSNIVYWLKRIWGKLGDGDVNVRPVDPTVDPPAWWEWLNRMLDTLLDGLVGVFNELLGGTGDLLEEVIHQFPFSIPWDIAAFLTALAAAPVTPVFDIVIPAVDGWWSQITFHIDLSPYNTTAATVRLMTKLVFAGLLAWKSRELLDMMDVTKW